MALFNRGDQVTLKSGGPKMTVIRYEGNDQVTCSWMANGTKQEDIFHEVQLKKWKNPLAFLTNNPRIFRK